MKVGFSLSPGGLLLPYHLGVLSGLSQRGYVTETTPLAGSSAGAIAVTAHATHIPELQSLEGTIRISDHCAELGGARGRLLPLLRHELDALLPEDAHDIIHQREGLVGLAHREVFPKNRPVLATTFETRDCLMDAVMDSSTFPFFSTNWPCRLVTRKGETFPRVVVDGFFSVPRERYGCPDFAHALEMDSTTVNDNDNYDLIDSTPVVQQEEHDGDRKQNTPPRILPDRTVTVSVFPHETVKLTASDPHDRISPPPEEDKSGQMGRLLQLAMQPSSRKELSDLYEQGQADAERWMAEEEHRERGKTYQERRENYARAVLGSKD